jgi:DNA-binding GntR family transcriptional regulator
MKVGVYFSKEVFNAINQEHFLIYKAIENSSDQEAAKIMEKHMKKLEFEHIITEFLNQ